MIGAREAIVEAAQRVLGGELHPLEGCRIIAGRYHELERELASDPAINTIIGIESESDHLPLGQARPFWDPEALRKKDEETANYLQRVGGEILDACKAIIARLAAG